MHVICELVAVGLAALEQRTHELGAALLVASKSEIALACVFHGDELGEAVRARVRATSGIELEWEIKRLCVPVRG